MRRVLLAFVAGMSVGVGGLALAQHGHGDGKGPEVKTLSAVDIDEEVSGKKAKSEYLGGHIRTGRGECPATAPRSDLRLRAGGRTRVRGRG